MKKNKRLKKIMFLSVFIALTVIAIAGMNVRTLIISDGLTRTAKKANVTDIDEQNVLNDDTFTSDVTKIGVMGSITNYSKALKQTKSLATSATRTVTMDLNDGYYTQIKVDTTEVYQAGYNTGVEDAKVDILELSISGTDVNTTAPPNPDSSVFQHTEGSINTGYVIRDKNNGNEFVWVPVKKDQKISLNVEMKENITSLTLTDPFGASINLGTVSGKTYTNTNITPTVNGMYTATVTTASGTKTQTLVVRSLYALDAFNDYPNAIGKATPDYTDIVDYTSSVNTNGGFYIGRYEAGAPTYRTVSQANANDTVSSIISTNGMPVCKATQTVYNYITESQAKGLAESMYTGSSYTCTLPTGSAWYRTLGWLIETGDKTLREVSYDSSSWGNYSNSAFYISQGKIRIPETGQYVDATYKSATQEAVTTGATTRNMSNNIYDLAGNVGEWVTAIVLSTQSPINHGGSYWHNGTEEPSTNRDDRSMFTTPQNQIDATRGFRPALFL